MCERKLVDGSGALPMESHLIFPKKVKKSSDVKEKKMGDVTYTYARSTQLYGQTLSLRVLVSPPEEFT